MKIVLHLHPCLQIFFFSVFLLLALWLDCVNEILYKFDFIIMTRLKGVFFIFPFFGNQLKSDLCYLNSVSKNLFQMQLPKKVIISVTVSLF